MRTMLRAAADRQWIYIHPSPPVPASHPPHTHQDRDLAIAHGGEADPHRTSIVAVTLQGFVLGELVLDSLHSWFFGAAPESLASAAPGSRVTCWISGPVDLAGWLAGPCRNLPTRVVPCGSA